MLAARQMARAQPLARLTARPAARLVLVRASSSSAAPSPSTRPSWELRLLYDGECPLCLKEVNFLREADAKHNKASPKIDFVDIALPSYDPAANAGISWEQAMDRIHAVTADGQIMVGVPVFKRTYELVGLGWVYAVTGIPVVMSAISAAYNVWAKYRTQLTGREDLPALLAKRRAAGLEDGASCRTPQGAGEGAGCEVPVGAGKSQGAR